MGGRPERRGKSGRGPNEPIAEELPIPEMAHTALQELGKSFGEMSVRPEVTIRATGGLRSRTARASLSPSTDGRW
jgi:hypothetical protein